MGHHQTSIEEIRALNEEIEYLRENLSVANQKLQLINDNKKLAESKYSALFDGLNDAIFIHELKREGFDTFIDVNKAACQRLEYSREELLSMSVKDIDKEDIVLQNGSFEGRAILEKNKWNVFETIHTSKSGKRIHVEITAKIFNIDGKQLIISLAKDISKSKIIETELIQSKEKLKSFLLAAPIGIGVVINRKIVLANDYFIEIVGYARDELIGKDSEFLYISKQEYLRVGKEKYKQISQTGIGTAETKFIRKNGDIIDVHISSSAIDYNDLSKGVTFTVSDVTDRKIVERALIESKGNLERVLTSMDDIVFVFDKNNYFKSVYASPERLSIPIDEFIGKLHSEIMPAHINTKFEKAIEEMKEKGSANYEYHMSFGNVTNYYSVIISPLIDDD